ncbi:hypothetical protein L3X38_031777 [Prunus dulcis]|uniref:Uncharacterized protein n=1 Tax=Prunus dulcis TaxID=3755 RepID=A0AAD4YV90_PRUDU|nr:hypothetical protein L3X38_031777 [Prunus dulcis]
MGPKADNIVLRRSRSLNVTHFPLTSSNLFFRQSNMTVLDASACLLPCGYLEVDRCYLILYFIKKAVICLPMKGGPLSSRCSTRMEHLNWVSSADPRLASASACAFSAQGTCWMVKIANFLIDNSFAKSKPAINASYFASLVEAGKPSMIACSNRFSEEYRMLAPGSSPMIAELTAELNTARYTNKYLSRTGFESRGGEVRSQEESVEGRYSTC